MIAKDPLDGYLNLHLATMRKALHECVTSRPSLDWIASDIGNCERIMTPAALPVG